MLQTLDLSGNRLHDAKSGGAVEVLRLLGASVSTLGLANNSLTFTSCKPVAAAGQGERLQGATRTRRCRAAPPPL